MNILLIEELNLMRSDLAAYYHDCEQVRVVALFDVLKVITVDDGTSVVEIV